MLTRELNCVRCLGAKRLLIIGVSLMGLVAVYLLQRELQNFFGYFELTSNQLFIVGRLARFIINDLLMILLIYGLFHKRKYVIFAFYVQLAGIFFLLVPYFIIRSYGFSHGPLISFLHRLVINPLLMVLLIPAFFYQEKKMMERWKDGVME